ncbi:MAG TPA: hypothetical protein PLV92_06155, partial [Pirellulaceae bacterium]|nr:hypothetical protein [Pirellulaceae bacterium]
LAGNPLAPENLRREAAELGVAPERIVFAPRAAFADHLARQRLADLFLDTTPVNAHTTASDALWVGLPVLTVAGSTFAGRVAGSLLHSLGLSELIATDLGDYERRADELIERREARSRLRSRLETLRTTARVFRGDLFARGVEAAYRRMWRLHVSGAGPQGFRVDEA